VPLGPEVPLVPFVPDVPLVPLSPDVPLVPEVPLEPFEPVIAENGKLYVAPLYSTGNKVFAVAALSGVSCPIVLPLNIAILYFFLFFFRGR
jgi:hypothetical protein